eukprot:5514-Pelagococcus_subviridis.AAC.1
MPIRMRGGSPSAFFSGNACVAVYSSMMTRTNYRGTLDPTARATCGTTRPRAPGQSRPGWSSRTE